MPPAKAAKALAGLLTHSPGPGLYSRMERAVQQMPKVIRTQELPGLLRKYKDGVPGWEVKAVAPELEGVQSISRQDLLDLIQQHSPAHTHREIVLGGRPQMGGPLFDVPEYQGSASRIGEGRGHGMTRYGGYSQGGQDYSELLLLQPGATGVEFGSHWGSHPQVQGTNQAVAHARYDTHGDALRINELQSDLGIHNRKAREYADQNPQIHFGERLNPPEKQGLPFPMEDAWADILIKRLALEAARQGHRAIEVASPRAIADKVGGSIDNYEHFYGKVVPGAIERLGRKMGGVVYAAPTPSPQPAPGYSAALDEMLGGLPGEGQLVLRDANEALRKIKAASPPGPRPAFGGGPSAAWSRLAEAYMGDGDVTERAHLLHDMLEADLARGGGDASAAAQMMPELVRLAENHAAAMKRYSRVQALADDQRAGRTPSAPRPPGRRYIMSDEMRKRILRDGIGMSVMGATATDPGAVLERLQEQE